MKLFVNLFCVTVLSTMLYACGGGTSTSEGNGTSLTGEIKIDGSSTVYPITEAIAEEFRFEHPDVRVSGIGYQPVGEFFVGQDRLHVVNNNALSLI